MYLQSNKKKDFKNLGNLISENFVQNRRCE